MGARIAQLAVLAFTADGESLEGLTPWTLSLPTFIWTLQKVELKEVLAALQVVAAAEYAGVTDAMTWLSGHLYRCDVVSIEAPAGSDTLNLILQLVPSTRWLSEPTNRL